jgi:hypothetical protein
LYAAIGQIADSLAEVCQEELSAGFSAYREGRALAFLLLTEFELGGGSKVLRKLAVAVLKRDAQRVQHLTKLCSLLRTNGQPSSEDDE